MVKILITDGSLKHSIALQKYLRKEMGAELHLVVQERKHKVSFSKMYGYADSVLHDELPLVLSDHSFDQVIPVSAQSVLTVSSTVPELALLPRPDRLNVVFKKEKTIELAQELGVPTPDSVIIRDLQDLPGRKLGSPIVVKSSNEVHSKHVYYVQNYQDLERYCVKFFEAAQDTPTTPERSLLLQEYIAGGGCGYFALFDHGRPVREFMHRRIREYPVSGGASTAAESYHDDRLKSYGRRLLEALEWNGVAMVEFKQEAGTGRFVLMEINGKFWGSAELAHKCGVNFVADMVRVFEGKSLAEQPPFDRTVKFFWPLDNDVLALLELGQLRKGLMQYFLPNSHTNVGQCIRVDFIKLFFLLKKVFL